MASECETRIRLKAEAEMRLRWPDARIIHELVLWQGGTRIDLAAVGPDYMALVEIKSERDVLHRLPHQIRDALAVSDETWICVAPGHAELIEAMGRSCTDEQVEIIRNGRCIGWTHKRNPGHVPELSRCEIRVETDTGFAPLRPRPWRRRYPDTRALLEMLWAAELQGLARPFGATHRWTRDKCRHACLDGMTGREIRAGTYAALRGRTFARADERIAA